MIKRLFYFGVLLVLLCNCTSKNTDKQAGATNDSIMKYLAIARNDTLDFKVRDKYNDKAFSLVDLKKNDTLTRYYLSSLSYNYINIKNWSSLKKIAKVHLDKSLVAEDTLNLARYYRYKAGYFKNTFIYDSSLYFYIKAENFYKKTTDELGLAIVYSNKQQLQYGFDDYIGANLSAKKAYNYYKKVGDIRGQYRMLVAIGNYCTVLREYKSAICAFENALKIIKKDSSIDNSNTCLNNLGNVYREKKQFRKAIYYLNLGLKDKEMVKKDPTLRGFLLNNLSYCKLQLKDYSGLPDMLFEAEKLMVDKDGIKESTITNLYLSNYYKALHDTVKSQYYAEKALDIADKVGAPYYYLTALTNAGSVNGEKASKYIVEYHHLNDSLNYLENKKRNHYFTIQFETDNIRGEKEMAIKQKWIISSIAGLIILIVVFLLIIYWQRAKQKELELIQSQQKANEEIYDLMLAQKNKEELARQGEKTRIAIELHDGVMNRLASTRLNLGILFHKNDEQTIQKCINEIDGIYEIEQEIRHIAHDLKSEVFNEKNSFISLLKEFVVTQNTVTNTNYQLENDELIDWNSISSSIKMNLYRIIQEACHNINKFAEAKTAIIRFVLDEKNLCLSITDNGKGFDPKTNSEGMGLKNIKHRVESLKGEFVITSKKNKKTTLNIIFSIK